MRPCREFEALLIDRAAGDLQEEAMEMLSQHLSECKRCSAEAAALEETLQWVKLPPKTAEERAAMASLPLRTAVAWRRAERRRSTLQGATVGFIGAAAAAALVLVPLTRQRAIPIRPVQSGVSTSLEMALESWAMDIPYAETFAGGGGDLGPSNQVLDDEGE